MNFLASDFREFQRYEDRLDDLAKDGKFQFAELVRGRFRKRTKEAASYADELLAEQHEYSKDEEYPTRFDAYAAGREQLRERWRLRIKAELLIEKLHGRERSDVTSQLSGRYRRIARQAREMTDERLCDIYLDSLIALYDPHSAYLSPTLLTSFNQTMTIREHSLGLVFRQCAGQFVIASFHPALHDAAAQHKLLGWAVIAIRRSNGDVLDVVEMHPDDFSHMIRFASDFQKSDTAVILELLNPETYERVSMSWYLFLSL